MDIKLRLTKVAMFIVIFMSSINAFGTHQIPDYLVIESDTFELYTNPLTAYLNFKNEKAISHNELKSLHTACWRGYVATWKLENDSLFLTKIEGKNNNDELISYDLIEEFGTSKVFAEWFTGTLISPRGKRLQFHNMGYASVYEREKQYHVWNGIVKREIQKNNLTFDDTLLYPEEKFLQDTISHIIETNLDYNSLKEEHSEPTGILLIIGFNHLGKIDDWRFAHSKEEDSLIGQEIEKTAKVELPKLPALMKVNHSYYQIPTIEVMIRYKIKNTIE
ncbi:hypothetical protein J1N10_00790 [Carboxylicivirga sp. A043]|uniref:hypothetical protein n=1 Tax=Carboxylicivirga litoralis TaxID=2816963 RepID=UPI0021CB6566|nr:hypothetical protein [Carboxylicivirga sp. A043]MCU4154495.1 hypothetical protein [Carboxylicivirga sp. A043]